MRKVSQEDYQRMRRWIYRFAFHIDLTLFQYYMENGSKEEVVKVLSFYQNQDGGFTSFDPDCWNPESAPVPTMSAYNTLKQLEITEKDNPMIQAMIEYISHCDYFTEKGAYWSIPSNNHYPSASYFLFPHAPWHPDEWPAEGYINGSYVDFVLTYFSEDSPMYQKILKVIEYRLQNVSMYQKFCSFTSVIEQEIEANDWLTLFDALEKHNMKSKEECDSLRNQVITIVRQYADPSVNESITRRMKETEAMETTGQLTEELLDEMVDSICLNRDWSEGGLRCDNPEERLKSLTCIGNIMWPIVELIDKLAKLKKHNRIEE